MQKLIMVLSQSYEFDPIKEYGLNTPRQKLRLEGGDAAVNAEITRRVLGE